MKCLEKDRRRRYETVAGLATDIQRHLDDEPVLARPPSVGYRIGKMVRRHRFAFAATAGIVAAIVIGTVVSMALLVRATRAEREQSRLRQQAEEDEHRAEAEARRATLAEAAAVSEKEAARRALTKNGLALAEAGLREGNGLIMRAGLESVPEDLRDTAWHYLQEQADTSNAQLGPGSGAAAHPRRPGVFALTRNNQVRLLDVTRGTTLLEFDLDPKQRTPNHRFIAAFTPDGESLAVARRHTAGMTVYRTSDGQKLRELAVSATTWFVFSPDGKQLLLLGETGCGLTMCDSDSGRTVWSLPDKPGALVTFGAFTPDGRHVLIAGGNDGLRVVNALDGAAVRNLPIPRASGTMLAVSASGLVALGDDAGLVHCLDLNGGSDLGKLFLPTRLSVTENDYLGFTPTGDQIVTAQCRRNGSRDIRVWDARTGRALRNLIGGSGLLRQVAIHPGSGELLTSGENTRAWNLSGATARWQFPSPRLLADVSFWGSDDRLFLSGPGNKAQLQSLESGSPVLLWKTSAPSSGAATVSADGRLAAFYERNAASREIVVLRRSGAEVGQAARFAAPPPNPTLFRLSPAGDRLAFLSFGAGITVLIIDAVNGTTLVTPEHPGTRQIWTLDWINGGRQIAGLTTAVSFRGQPGAEDRLVIWDAATGKIVRSAAAPGTMTLLAVSPDGQRLAEAGETKIVRIRDTATLAVLKEFRAHNEAITALAWHPSRPVLATASADLSVKLWDLATGNRLRELRGPLTPPERLTFSPGGNRLACASPNDAVRIWEIE